MLAWFYLSTRCKEDGIRQTVGKRQQFIPRDLKSYSSDCHLTIIFGSTYKAFENGDIDEFHARKADR